MCPPAAGRSRGGLGGQSKTIQAWKARTHLREEGAVEPLDPLLVLSA
jgi:hypothetical protein